MKTETKSSLTNALKDSQILRLRPHSESRFRNFDYVSFKFEDKKMFGQLVYSEQLYAFVLYLFTNSNFNEPILLEDGRHQVLLLCSVGIDKLTKL